MTRPARLELLGLSSTGTKHGLLIDRSDPNNVKFTITGNNGKRHAAVLLPDGPDIERIREFLSMDWNAEEEN